MNLNFYKCALLLSGVMIYANSLYASSSEHDISFEEKKSIKRERPTQDDHESFQINTCSSDNEHSLSLDFSSIFAGTQESNTNKKMRTLTTPSTMLDTHACRLMMNRSIALSKDTQTPLDKRLQHIEKAIIYGETTLTRSNSLDPNDLRNLADIYFDTQEFNKASSLYNTLSLIDNTYFDIEENRKRAYLLYLDGEFEKSAELYYEVLRAQKTPLLEDFEWTLRLYNTLLDELGTDENLNERESYHQRIEQITAEKSIFIKANQ